MLKTHFGQSYKLAGLLLAGLLIGTLLVACGATDENPVFTSPLPALPPTITPVPAPGINALTRPELGKTNITTSLVGGGSTFARLIYEGWFPAFKEVAPNVKLEYRAIGSGGGRTGFLGTPVPALNNNGLRLDFAGSDAPFGSQQLELASNRGNIFHVPTAIGAVVPIYNLPQAPDLRLSGPTLAGIYLGRIAKWNDTAIELDNPALKGKLPDKAIKLVVRARANGGSGTSEIFTRYLSVVDTEFRDVVGPSDKPNWEKGGTPRKATYIEGEGNEGMLNAVRTTDAAIGYIDQGEADKSKVTYAAVRNKTGRYIKPEPNNLSSVTAAAAGAFIPDDFRTYLVDAEGTGTYPIVGFTWIITWRELKQLPDATPDKAAALVNFLWWAIHDGQERMPAGYARIPATLVPRLERLFVPDANPELNGFVYDGKPIVR